MWVTGAMRLGRRLCGTVCEIMLRGAFLMQRPCISHNALYYMCLIGRKRAGAAAQAHVLTSARAAAPCFPHPAFLLAHTMEK